MDKNTQVALIREDYIGKIKNLFTILSKERIGLYRGKEKALYLQDYKVKGYVSEYIFRNFDQKVYDIVLNPNGMLYAIFSNYMEDFPVKIENLKVIDIVSIYNELAKIYLK